MPDFVISVITLNFNKGITLERTIKSVLGQNYYPIEYIIVDGGSTDNSIEIINKYHKKISKWVSESDKGPIDALNKGIQMTTGDVILLVSSDDYLEPGIIGEVAAVFQQHSEIDIVNGNLRYFNLETNEVLICKPFKKSNADIYKNIYKWPAIYVNTFFVKKEMYDQVGKLDLNYEIACDFELCQRFFKKRARFFYLDRIVANHQSGGASYGSIKGYLQLKDISIRYGCSKIRAYYDLGFKLLERGVGNLLVKCGLGCIRNFYAKIFYKDIILERKPTIKG